MEGGWEEVCRKEAQEMRKKEEEKRMEIGR